MFPSLFKSRKGFTLIEVVIVLAIAGLIFVIVFIAIGSAQRARRDQDRRAAVGQVFAAVDQYASNTNGSIPTSAAFLSTYAPSLKDPDTDNTPVWSTTTNTATSSSGIVGGNGQICTATAGTKGTTNGSTTASNRNYAVVWWSEGAAASQCRDNR